MEYEEVVREFDTELEKKEHVFKINLLRRHLEPLGWGIAFKKLLALKGVRRGKGRQKKTATVAVFTNKSVAGVASLGEWGRARQAYQLYEMG